MGLRHRVWCTTLLLIFATSLTARAAAAPARTPQSEPEQFANLPIFELHSGFWINLHHTLYGQARASRDGRGSPSSASGTTKRTPNEEIAWDNAVAYYAENFVDKDLLFRFEKESVRRRVAAKTDAGFERGCGRLSGARMAGTRSGESEMDRGCIAAGARKRRRGIAAAGGNLPNAMAEAAHSR